ncbi:hypothetical protein K1719_002875 [Acacia pycnantha]|nr:hypothetical protein K1719_002875 [Acacia pycnantha]
MDKILQIAAVLYDVLKAMVSPKDIENKVGNLPMPIIHPRNDSSGGASRVPMERFKEINDILDWLSSVFG